MSGGVDVTEKYDSLNMSNFAGRETRRVEVDPLLSQHLFAPLPSGAAH